MYDLRALLEAKGIHYVNKGGDEVGIVCPNQGSHSGGRDSKPSFNINGSTFQAHCFSCNYSLNRDKTLRWLLGEDLDEEEFAITNLNAQLGNLARESDNVRAGSRKREIFFPSGAPWTEDFRGISASTYEMLGAVKVSKGRYTDRICFPIILRGELLGVDARDLTGSATAKYIRTKDSTCKDNWLYPFDVVKPMLDHLEKRYVILAEGIFHSLNAVDKGFPCLNFFGCHNFTRKKLLMLLDLDLDFVVFWRDNDKAGLVAEQIVCSMVSQYFPVYIANTDNVPEGMDLGDLPDYLIQYGIENLHEPVLPKCLEGTNGVKPRLDNKPYELCMQDCPYSMNGLCMNIPWHKEVKSEP